MIFRQGEYILYLGKEREDLFGRVGQINKVIGLEKQYPYEVVIVDKEGVTQKFLSQKGELRLIKRLEFDVEISEYIKHVKR